MHPQKNSIALIIPYFGKFPEWAPLFFETLRRNSNIDFFYTDCETNGYEAPNIYFKKTSFAEYVEFANNKKGKAIKFILLSFFKAPFHRQAKFRLYDFFSQIPLFNVFFKKEVVINSIS